MIKNFIRYYSDEILHRRHFVFIVIFSVILTTLLFFKTEILPLKIYAAMMFCPVVFYFVFTMIYGAAFFLILRPDRE